MVLLIVLCNHCSLAKLIKFRPTISRFHASRVLCSSYTDAFVENLVLEEGIKQESSISKYFENLASQNFVKETLSKISSGNKNFFDLKFQDLACCIEKEIDTKYVPNKKLKYLLIYFMKNGNINGVKAVQSIVEKHNLEHFKSLSQYNHYLAEAFWISGKIHISLQLFSSAYDNTIVRPKVKIMLPNLFPLLISRYSEATISKVVYNIESFSLEKQDNLILACLWRELFQSTWFSDQEQAVQLFQKNKHLLKIIQFMVPSIGKNMLRCHRIEDFYRLIQFTLENELETMTGTLLRLMFEYYYVHENIERCTAVVKYSSDLNSVLTEDQQRRYVSLLLRSKGAVSSKLNVKKAQHLKYKF